MPYNAKKFRDRIKTFAKPSTFDIQFTGLPESIFLPADIKTFDELQFRAYSTQLPGINLDTVERRYHGPQRMIPTGYFYQQMNISIIETGDYKMRELFDYWVNQIAPAQNGYYLFYYDELIAKEMLIKLYDKANNEKIIKTYKLEEVYPIGISPVVLDWGYRDTFTAINIDLAYRKWSVI